MDIRQLRHFAALAEYKHFSRAAQALNLSQSALSRSIIGLEEELGVRLVDRELTPISLTPFGRLVLERTEPILMQIHQLGREVDLMRGIAVGELTVGASPIPSDSLVGPCLGKLLGEHPGLRAKLQTKPWTELVVDLRRGELELFVAEGRSLMDDDDLRVEPLEEFRVGLCCRPDHPLLELAPVPMKILADYPIGLPNRLPPGIMEQLRDAFGFGSGRRAKEFRAQVEYDMFISAKTIIERSDLICLSPEIAFRRAVSVGRLAELRVIGLPYMAAKYCVVTLRGQTLSPGAAALRDAVLASFPFRKPGA